MHLMSAVFYLSIYIVIKKKSRFYSKHMKSLKFQEVHNTKKKQQQFGDIPLH